MIVRTTNIKDNIIVVEDGEDIIFVYRPNMIERLFKITWEDKINKVIKKLKNRETIIKNINQKLNENINAH